METLNIISIFKNDTSAVKRTIDSVYKAHKPQNLVVKHFICAAKNDELFKELIVNHPSKDLIVASVTDEGIYNAMNKGLAKVEQGWVMFLNGGDTLHSSSSLIDILKCIEQSDSSLIQMQTQVGLKITPAARYSWLQLFLGRRMHAHPSFMFNREAIRGLSFDESYKIVGDFKFILEAFRENRMNFAECVVVDFEGGGISSSDLPNLIQESNRVRLELCHLRIAVPLVKLWNKKIKYFSHL
jgi:hypothetical protein